MLAARVSRHNRTDGSASTCLKRESGYVWCRKCHDTTWQVKVPLQDWKCSKCGKTHV